MSTALLEKPVSIPAKKTQVYYTRCPAVPTNSSLAYQLGYLDEELAQIDNAQVKQEIIGLDPRLHPTPGEPLSLRHAGHVKALWARSEGADNRVISLSWLEGSYPTYAIDPAIQTVADLKGKRLAVFKFEDAETIDLLRAQQLRIYDSTLTTANLSLRDVKLVDVVVNKDILKPKEGEKSRDVFGGINRELVIQLLRGHVDAITAQLPADIVSFLRARLVHDTQRNHGKTSRANPSVLRGVVVSAELLRENRELVVRILARHLEAAEWAKANPDETVRLIAKDLQIPENLLRSRYENLSEGLQVGLEEDKIAALRDLKDFYLRNGFIQHDFDVDGWVDSTLLADARELLNHRRAGQSK
jgi:ABC-type nitrate/sulfonate/bicarbonate transport system substrate-binding protein